MVNAREKRPRAVAQTSNEEQHAAGRVRLQGAARPYAGNVYRVMAGGLRIHNASRPERVINRPREGVKGPYIDSDLDPTLLTVEDGDEVDIPSMLRSGAIVPWVPPKPAPVKEPARKEVTNNGKGTIEGD